MSARTFPACAGAAGQHAVTFGDVDSSPRRPPSKPLRGPGGAASGKPRLTEPRLPRQSVRRGGKAHLPGPPRPWRRHEGYQVVTTCDAAPARGSRCRHCSASACQGTLFPPHDAHGPGQRTDVHRHSAPDRSCATARGAQQPRLVREVVLGFLGERPFRGAPKEEATRERVCRRRGGYGRSAAGQRSSREDAGRARGRGPRGRPEGWPLRASGSILNAMRSRSQVSSKEDHTQICVLKIPAACAEGPG